MSELPYFDLRQSPVDKKWRAWIEIDEAQTCVAVSDTKANVLKQAQKIWKENHK